MKRQAGEVPALPVRKTADNAWKSRLELTAQLSVAFRSCAEVGLYFDLSRDALPILDANDVLRLLNEQPRVCV